MRLFFDTSAFVKRYVVEPGSERVLALCGQATAVGLSVILVPEVLATLRRLVREGRLTEQDYRALKEALMPDVSDADVCDLTPAVLDATTECLERNALRAMDGIHLGSALIYRPDRFVSADSRQLVAARSEGLVVEALDDQP